LSLGGDRDCPLCGASPAAQQHEHGLRDIERARAAASAEITKIREQRADLTETVQQLYAERVTLSDQLRTSADDLKKTEDEITRLSPGAGEARRQLAEIMTVRDHVKRGISLI
jgi:septal ring factor EnvC (AmiA/AmiB activator)